MITELLNEVNREYEILNKMQKKSKIFRIHFDLRLIEELAIHQNRERRHKQSPLKETLLIELKFCSRYTNIIKKIE